MTSDAVISAATGAADARGRMAVSPRVGMFAAFGLLSRGPEMMRLSWRGPGQLPPAAGRGGRHGAWCR
jgi:hypothetical protein